MGTSPLVTGGFWRQAAERAAKTFAQALGAAWLASGDVLDLVGIDWAGSLGVAGAAALLSVVTSVASSPVGPSGSPSLVEVDPVRPRGLG